MGVAMGGAAAGGWAEFAAAFLAFLLSHGVPARPAVRARLRAALGGGGYAVVYSLVSVVLLAWLIEAAGRAPFVPLWAFAPWQMWVPNALMPLACLLAAHGLGAANPLSFGGRAAAPYDPDQPGIAGVARHPLLLALLLWSGGHVVPNGDLAHVILFGGFAVVSAAGMAVLDQRLRRRLGRDEWTRLAARTSLWPAAALIDGRWRPAWALRPWRVAAGVLAWAALLGLHPWAIGVSPLPPL